MRTNTLLLAAAALAAGAIGASAQVYSANVVGYINLPLTPGYNVIANQLASGDNTIGTVLTGLPDGSTLAKWDFAAQSFGQPYTYYAGDGWYDADLNPATISMAPTNGIAYLVNVPSAVTVTLVGEVPQGTTATTVRGPGYDLLASVPPVVSGLSTNGFPKVDGMTYTIFTGGAWAGAPSYPYTYYAGDGWYDPDLNAVDPAPAVGAGFLVNNPGASGTWTRSFTVQ